MNYIEALDFIHSTQKFGSVLGLDNIRKLLKLLGNPQNSLKFIHIAGTNGKGSTAAMINSVLQNAGYKTGLYISPFIIDFKERIQIDNEFILEKDVAQLASEIKRNIEIMLQEGYTHPTEFEIITALAFLYFARYNCDYVVLEVGLGGRFDATNIIENPLLSVITLVDIDHIEQLGITKSQIAFEKCGIIKKERPVVTYPDQDKTVLEVVEHCAKAKRSNLIIADKSNLQILFSSFSGSKFYYNDVEYNLKLAGLWQIDNAVTAITACNELINSGVPLGRENIVNGIAQAHFPGRFEILKEEPLIIIDGAHNLSGAQALYKTFENYTDGKKIILVMGMLEDKDYKNAVKLLAPLAKKFIATTPDSPRALEAQELALCAQKYLADVTSAPDINIAVQLAIGSAGKDDIICFCGSLYLIGIVRQILSQ